MKEPKLYAQRDAYNLDCESGDVGNYYCNHISAMTREGLHSKSDIAAELAVRDAQIDYLLEALCHDHGEYIPENKQHIKEELPQFYIED